MESNKNKIYFFFALPQNEKKETILTYVSLS